MNFFIRLLYIIIILYYSTDLYSKQNSNKIIIDDFESLNPYKNYQLNKGDESGITLNISSDRINGNRSLELNYYLKSSLPTGTYVAIEKYFKEGEYLNLEDLVKFVISIKGNGSGNILKIVFIDGSDELWEYENLSVLNSTIWERLSIYLSYFQMQESTKNNGVFDADKIKGYKIIVYNTYSKTIHGKAVKSSQGSILIDYFYTVLKGAEEEEIKGKGIEGQLEKISPINFAGALYGEYFKVPNEKNELKHWGKIDINANYEKVSAKMVIASESQNFSHAAYRVNEKDVHTGQVHQNYPQAVIPFIQLRVSQISKYIRNVTIGNLRFEYSRYTFSPTLGYDDIWGIEKIVPDWGYKGISTEGSMEFLNYHGFIINHSSDSYTYGVRLEKLINNIDILKMNFFNIKLYYVASGDTVQSTNDNTCKKAGDDQVYSIEVASRILNYKIGIEGFAGYNIYNKYAHVDYSNPFQPVFLFSLDEKILEKDIAYKGKILFDKLFLPNLLVSYEYRYFGEDFKPKYRLEPNVFDDIESNLIGNNVSANYRIWGFTLSGEFDELTRISNKKYYRKKRAGGIGYNKLKNVFLSYFAEWRREYYAYVSSRSYYSTSRDDEVFSHELYIKTQLMNNLDFGFKVRSEDIEWSSGERFNMHVFYFQSHYYFSSNFLIFMETRITRFYNIESVNTGYYPYADNFMRIGTMFNF